MTRKEEREQAFIIIFEKSLNDSPIEEIIEDARENLELEKSDYVESTVFGVFDNIAEIDDLISSKLKSGWTIGRISKVALALLRLGVYEIKYNPSIPNGVAINESVALCKNYTIDPDDSSFLNGILGTIAREVEG